MRRGVSTSMESASPSEKSTSLKLNGSKATLPPVDLNGRNETHMKKAMYLASALAFIFLAIVTAKAQDRDELDGVRVTASVSAEDDHTNKVEVTIKNNNDVAVSNVRYEVRYSCGGESTSITKTF